ncbi:hypothetical protein ccbrp13_70660 [Ktedonobacteria bacterium brp13]|nr:hypothetical protein ccbrp13_70660 [Ktedonobacteria bacterium brp13]
MIHNSKWRFGFVTSTLLLLWSIVFVFVLAPSPYLTMGPAFGLLYLTEAVLMLMTLLMLLLVFFKRTRPISFGLTIPLLVLHVGLFIITLIITPPAWNETNWELLKPQILFIHFPAVIAFLVVGITYMTVNRHVGGQPRKTEGHIS